MWVISAFTLFVRCECDTDPSSSIGCGNTLIFAGPTQGPSPARKGKGLAQAQHQSLTAKVTNGICALIGWSVSQQKWQTISVH